LIEWFLRHYLKNQSESANPRISLVRAEPRGLPPTTIIAAEIDPLRSEGRLLAERLQAVGVRVDYRNYDGVTHEFFGMGAVLDKARAATGQAAKGLREAFGNK
jgi:acetyl esterase